jgi:glycosyltransferase involved in cell wall biosynthesis
MKSTVNILQFICPTGFYGAERWILALSKHLPSSYNSELAVTLEKGSHDLKLVEEFTGLGHLAHEIPMRHPFDISVINKLVELIKTRHIDVIHTHGYKSDILGVIAAHKANIPVVVTPHGFENAADIKLRTFIWLGCQAMKFATKVVPLSPQLCADVRAYRIVEPQLEYIQNGVDLSEVEAVRDDPTISSKTPKKRIGFVGQMISRKNIPALLRVFEQYYKQDPNVELVFLGDGDAREALEALANTLTCAPVISFLGFRDDRLALLKTFDLFVMTSTLEGIPRCLMEACAMGIPVAAFDIPGIDQLIKHKQTGLLAPLHDEAQLLGHWECLLTNTQYAQQLTDNGVAYVNEHYSAARMAREYAELFTRLTDQPRGDYVQA